MAGTFTDKSTLANDNAFIDKCRVAMLFRANELLTSVTAQKLPTLQQATNIIQSAGGNAASMAWIVATTNPTIGALAPIVPPDGDVQFAVNAQLTLSLAQV